MAIPKFPTGINLSNHEATNAADPTAATSLATKQYVDNMLAGLANKRYARLKTTANVALATGGIANGVTIDGKVVATGDRIFAGSQTTGSENGIYIAPASGAATRATDFDAGTEIPGALITVSEGTVNGDTMWMETTDGPITIGTTSLAFQQFSVGVTYTADGQGITLSSNQFSLALDGTTLSKSASGLRIGSGAAGAGLVEATGVLAVGAGTGISVAADTVGVDTAVIPRKFAADCVVTTNPQSFNHALGTDVDVEVWEGNNQVFPDVTKSATSGGTVTVDWGGAPTVGQYRVVVRG
jgi:phage-related tail fiber protein